MLRFGEEIAGMFFHQGKQLVGWGIRWSLLILAKMKGGPAPPPFCCEPG